MFKSELKSKDITCDLELRSFDELGIDYLLTDPSRVSQLLINLLTNAISESIPFFSVKALAQRP